MHHYPPLPSSPRTRLTHAFTLIELLVVVAIIAILASIALPNFLEAQTRAKVTRAKADMRTVVVGIESYAVDTNTFPPGFGVYPNGKHWTSLLTTPIAYVGFNSFKDQWGSFLGPFDNELISYEAVQADGHVVEVPHSPPWTVPDTGKKIAWWWLASRGPDGVLGFRSADIEEANIRQYFYESNQHPDKWLGITYDPTNGTTSIGNIYKSGGNISNFAGHAMQR